MDFATVLAISASILVSIGGGAALVFALSSWLGKIWASRIMASDQATHAQSLERLRSKLETERTAHFEHYKRQLDVTVATHLRETQDKLAIYRAATDIVATLLSDFDRVAIDGSAPPDARERFDRFNRERLKAYGYMAMLAPQPVMDAFDALIDFCLMVAHGDASYDWAEIRRLALALLNEIRKDVGIDKSPIEYKGRL